MRKAPAFCFSVVFASAVVILAVTLPGLAQTAGDLYSTDNIVGKMRYVQAGIFTQGSPVTEPGRNPDENQFSHLLTKNIAVMETAVTRQMWVDLRALYPSLPAPLMPDWFHPASPIDHVTWSEAVLFANVLSIHNGLAPCYFKDSRLTVLLDTSNYRSGPYFLNAAANGYRLPTEGEREYFSRAGTTGPFSINEPNYTNDTYASCVAGTLPALETVAWFCASGLGIQPVGTKAANPWNLKDVHGNVFEFCWDLYGPYPAGNSADFLGPSSGNLRVIRGGACFLNASYCRSAYRYGRTTYFHDFDVGFRLVRTINPAPGPAVTVTSPAGSESWWVGSARWITWTASSSIEYVKIEYSTNNGSAWVPVVASTANVGRYSWTVPNTPSSACLVRVSDAANAANNDACAANFSIIPVPPPAMDLSRNYALFHAASGQTAVPSQWVTIRNSSGGTLSWSAGPSDGWVSVTPSSGSDGGQIKIDVNPAGFDPGTYQASIEVSDPQATNSPQTVHVWLTKTADTDEPYLASEHYCPPIRGGLLITPMDFDSDGDQDLVCSAVLGGYDQSQLLPNACIYAIRNDGQGNFVDATAEVFVGSNITISANLVPADLNGDGREDLYVADFGADASSSGGQDLVFIQTADGRLRNEGESRLPVIGSGGAVAGDIDGDGDIDILRAGNYFHNWPLFLINDGTGHFTLSSDRLPPGLGFKNLACAFIDHDKDGDLDLFFGQDGNRNILLINNGTGHFSQAPVETFPPTLYDGATMCCSVADFDVDGWPDVAATAFGTDAGIQLMLNNGNGTFRDESGNIPHAMGFSGNTLVKADINNDGWMDLLSGGLIFLNQGDAVFTAAHEQLLPELYYMRGWSTAAADVDNDDDADLFELFGWDAHGVGQTLCIYRNIKPYVTATPVPLPDAPVLSTPADGSTVRNNSPSLIWNPVATALDYELEVATDESFASPLISLTGITPVSAKVGPLQNATTYYWRVRAFNTRGAGPWSAVFDFSISPITVVAPDGGENWPVGTTHSIIWTSKGISGNVTIDLHKNDAFHSLIGEAAAASGAYSWAIPSGLPEGNDYKVRVYQGTASDLSDAAFSTYAEGVISGHITACGTPLAGAVLTGLPGEPETDAAGFYSVSVPYGWSGKAVPVHLTGGHIFEPASVTYSNVTADQTSDYKAYKGILPREREILTAFYNATNGDSWPEWAKEGWKTPPLEGDGFAADGTEGSWSGVGVLNHRVTYLAASAFLLAPAPVIPPALGELTALVNLQLYNGYSGEIPVALGNLTNLEILIISGSPLSGSIPPSFVNLSKLGWLLLGGNQLSGNIPLFLTSMNIGRLDLSGNQFSGAIPAGLGTMTALDTLLLDCNQLSGEIPAGLANLTKMMDDSLTLAYNSLYTNNPTLLAYLATKAPDGWADTQTLAPAGVQAVPTSSTSVTVSWTPIAYTANGGGYRVYFSNTPGGPYTFFGQTAGKIEASMQVTGLAPGTKYYFVVQTQTDPVVCRVFPNTVISPYSAEVWAMTPGLAPQADDIVADFGTAGLWLWSAGVWSSITGVNPDGMIAADTDGDNEEEIVVDFGAVGLWIRDVGAWTQLSGVNADGMAAADADGDGKDDLWGDFGAIGLWLWNEGSWTQLSGINPDGMIGVNADADPAKELVVDFGTVGLWIWDSGVWTQLSGVNADGMITAGVDADSAGEVAADFGGVGLWLWDSDTWSQLSGVNAEGMVGGDLDADSEDELVVDFSSLGLWLWNDGSWSQVSGVNAEFLLSANVTSSTSAELIADFGSLGIWMWDGGVWGQISTVNPESMIPANLDTDAEKEVVADFSATGIWTYNGSVWSQLSATNPESMIARHVAD